MDYFGILDLTLKREILSYLPDKEIINTIPFVCSDFNKVINTEAFWQNRTLRRFDEPSANLKSEQLKTWKMAYVVLKKEQATQRLISMVIEAVEQRNNPNPTMKINIDYLDQLIHAADLQEVKIDFRGNAWTLFDILSGTYENGWGSLITLENNSHPISVIAGRLIINDPSIIFTVREQRRPFIRCQCFPIAPDVQTIKALECLQKRDFEHFRENPLLCLEDPYVHPLTAAVDHRNLDIIKYFIENKIYKPTDKGSHQSRDPIARAQESGYWEISDYLKKALNESMLK